MAGSLKIELMQPMELKAGSEQLGGITAHALAYVQGLGIPITRAPMNGYQGGMPGTLTSLGDDELGDLLNNLGEWCAYLDGQLAIADSEREAAEAAYEFIKAHIRMSLKANEEGKKYTVSDKNDITTTDPRVVEAWHRTLYTESSYQIIRSIANKAQRNWETISRRITQRGQEVDRMKRENGVAGIPASSRTFRRT